MDLLFLEMYKHEYKIIFLFLYCYCEAYFIRRKLNLLAWSEKKNKLM